MQCLVALSWTLYVLFLPGLLAQAGIERRWLPALLVADQLIFAACDWAAGVYADRAARAWKRLGRVVTATTMLSSAALLAMPWIATSGDAALLLAVIAFWAATSSALRAPVFALLGRVRETHEPASGTGAVSIALVGISLANAAGPLLASVLRGIDARMPLALSAVALAVAGLWALRADRFLPPLVREDDGAANPPARRRAWSLAGTALVAALGAQAVTAVLAQPLLARFVGADAPVWAASFWVGFALGLVPGARAMRGSRPFLHTAAGLACAGALFVAVEPVSSLWITVAGIVAAGAGWGWFSTMAFTSAVSISRGRAALTGAGTASGLLFSAFALAALARLAYVAAGLGRNAWTPWIPLVAWVAAAALLVVLALTAWRAREETVTARAGPESSRA